MDPRQEILFKKIVIEYIKTAEPVGSLKLSEGIRMSSATVRNEMADLEKAGLIHQPHTSAGRVPTEKGYRFYIENFVGSGKIDKVAEEKVKAAAEQLSGEEKIKMLARAVAETAEEAVVVAFSVNQLYYTGLSYLFAEPEFHEQRQVTSVSEVLDYCESVMPQVLDLISQKTILLGKENPLGAMCSFVAVPLIWKSDEPGVFGILGPMRMDYERNLGLVRLVQRLLV